MKLSKALGSLPPQAVGPAVPGSPGSAAGPQLSSLFEGLQQIDPSSQPLQLGPNVAANNEIDPRLAESLKQAFGRPSPNSAPAPQQLPQAQPVNPYSNFANKVTGKSYK